MGGCVIIISVGMLSVIFIKAEMPVLRPSNSTFGSVISDTLAQLREDRCPRMLSPSTSVTESLGTPGISVSKGLLQDRVYRMVIFRFKNHTYKMVILEEWDYGSPPLYLFFVLCLY